MVQEDAFLVDRPKWDFVHRALAEPFAAEDVGFKPQKILPSGKAIMVAYIDARTVVDRLNAVVGVDGWSDSYVTIDFNVTEKGAIQTYGGVKCSLSVLNITKEDIGTPSFSDAAKGAVSDALKRAAVKFGIGRYLYDLGNFWVDWDDKKKAPKEKPTLPATALPSKKNPDDAILALFKDLWQNPAVDVRQLQDIFLGYALNLPLTAKRDIFQALVAIKKSL